MNRKSKTFALSTLAVGLTVLVVAGIESKDWFRELLLIHKLEAKDEEIVSKAVEELGEMGSGKTVPYIFQRLKQDPVGRQLLAKCAEAIVRMGPAAVPHLVKEMENAECRLLSVTLLGEIGPRANNAVPALTKLMNDKDEPEGTCQAAADALKKIQGAQDEEKP